MRELPPDLPPPPPSPGSWDPERVRDRDAGYLPGSPWNSGRFWGLFGAWLVGGFVGAFLAIALGFDPAEDAVGLAVTVVSQTVAALAVVVAVSSGSGRGDLARDIGLRFRGRDAVGILWGVGLQIAVAVLLSPLVRLISDDFETQQQVADLAESTSDAGGRLILVVMFVLVAPFIEEVIFRGAMMAWLARLMHIRWAIVLSAAAFAGVHLADPNAVLAVPSLFVIGVVLGWAAHRRGSIGIAIFIHAGVNLLGAIVLIWGDSIVDFLEEAEQDLQSLAALIGVG